MDNCLKACCWESLLWANTVSTALLTFGYIIYIYIYPPANLNLGIQNQPHRQSPSSWSFLGSNRWQYIPENWVTYFTCAKMSPLISPIAPLIRSSETNLQNIMNWISQPSRMYIQDPLHCSAIFYLFRNWFESH